MSFIDFIKDKNIENYFGEKIQECKNYDKIPKELRKCNCCNIHRENFPTIGSVLPAFDSEKLKRTKACTCPCRHIARHICREWDRLNEVEDISTDEYSEESDSEGSLVDFIVPDKMSKKERKELDKALKQFRK